MNRTALIPLCGFLLVIIIATVIVAHYESALTANNTIAEKKSADNFYPELVDNEAVVKISGNENKGLVHLKNIDNKPNLYLSITKAKDFITVGKYSEAASLLKTIIVFYPENVEALSLLAGIYCMSRDYEVAYDLFKRILKLNPNNYLAQENLGIVLEEMKDYDEALSCFYKAITINPKSSLSYLHIAKIYSEKDNKMLAVKSFLKAYHLLGDKIYPFTLTSDFDKIRDMPEFIEIVEMSRRGENSLIITN